MNNEQPPINQNYGLGAPPPTYQQQGSKPGQTYYQPPPPQNMGGQQQHPPHQPPNFQRRIVNFYNPPQGRKVGMMRRFLSICGCCIIIGLVVGLAAGLTTRSRSYSSYGSNSAYCRTNSDCYSRYGSGTYCYNGYCSR
ncbi:hypothetical protein BCR42DRAFT_495056 [Absidia repens]|uniref:Uncharacterized protein n=1 Tax=Absidia repens TaxID=90262 RepID=A0A1X2I5Z9_9FUNG|nr:hypothetical protein BCR42DRAFT_495056 [Absidia repens]